MDYHLGYDKNDPSGHHSGNSRNGFSSKKLKGDHGEIEIQTPRDRNANFEPELIKKGQTRTTSMDKQILRLYAKGMSTRYYRSFSINVRCRYFGRTDFSSHQ